MVASGVMPNAAATSLGSMVFLQRCLAHRAAQHTVTPHVIVTKGTKAGRGPASVAYFSHVLDDCSFGPRMIRCTRLIALVNQQTIPILSRWS